MKYSEFQSNPIKNLSIFTPKHFYEALRNIDKNLPRIHGSKFHRFPDPEHWDLDPAFLNVSKIAKREEKISCNIFLAGNVRSCKSTKYYLTFSEMSKCRDRGFFLSALTVCSGSFTAENLGSSPVSKKSYLGSCDHSLISLFCAGGFVMFFAFV